MEDPVNLEESLAATPLAGEKMLRSFSFSYKSCRQSILNFFVESKKLGYTVAKDEESKAVKCLSNLFVKKLQFARLLLGSMILAIVNDPSKVVPRFEDISQPLAQYEVETGPIAF